MHATAMLQLRTLEQRSAEQQALAREKTMRIVVGRLRSQSASRSVQAWKAYVQRRIWLRGFLRHSMNTKLTAAFNTLASAVSRRKHYAHCIGKGIQCLQVRIQISLQTDVPRYLGSGGN